MRAPRVVSLLGWAQDTGDGSRHPFCLVFELLDGGSLADFWASLATHEKIGGTVDGVQHMGFVSAILVASIDAVICS